MMILLKNAEVYTPERVGKMDILTGGGKILAMDKNLDDFVHGAVTRIDLDGLRAIPGLVDCHVHIAGAGGEGGPATRTPELPLSAILEGGITSVVGCLGTDGFTRTPESVLMRAKALRAEGISCWMYTGAYQVPTPTITGDVGRDIALIDEVIGVGEISISDHRSSYPDGRALAHLAGHARVGGMLGGKAGIVNLHMGDVKSPFSIIEEAVACSALSFKQFLPTHCNRNDWILEDALEYGKKGWVDVTTSAFPFFPDEEINPSLAVEKMIQSGVPLEHITMSSDGGGSLPSFHEDGSLRKLVMGPPSSMMRELRNLVLDRGLELQDALKPVTSNPATILKLPGKGRLAVGFDADICFVDNWFRIIHLMARGQWMFRDGVMVYKGSFDD